MAELNVLEFFFEVCKEVEIFEGFELDGLIQRVVHVQFEDSVVPNEFIFFCYAFEMRL